MKIQGHEVSRAGTLAGLGNRLAGLAVVGAVVCLWSSVAQAQINPFQRYKGPVLSKADLDEGMQAAGRLLNQDEAKVGASESWSGAKSGNRGTLTVLSAFEQKGRTCRALSSVVDYKAGTKRTWKLNVCRIESGEWKVV